MITIEKQNKLVYYIKGYYNSLFAPQDNYEKQLSRLFSKIDSSKIENANERIDYYCKLSKSTKTTGAKTVKSLQVPKSPKTYYFDAYRYAKFFRPDLFLDFVFGDVTEIPETPSLVKSRPISDDNANSVLMKLNYARHFRWVKNDIDFSKKKDKLIGRGAIFEGHQNRINFFKQYFNDPLCDLGQTNSYGDFGWQKPKISIQDHLEYKFILSLEGNDVATNLKWIMSSNSIAVMPKPKYETWFMEGKLIGGVHFIEVKDDFSDVKTQLEFYINHPEECEQIIRNANHFCTHFFDKDVEDYCNFKVLEKYFTSIHQRI